MSGKFTDIAVLQEWQMGLTAWNYLLTPAGLLHKHCIGDYSPETLSQGKPPFTVPQPARPAIPNRKCAVCHGQGRHRASGDAGRAGQDPSKEESPPAADPQLSAEHVLPALGTVAVLCVKHIVLFVQIFTCVFIILCSSSTFATSLWIMYLMGEKCRK